MNKERAKQSFEGLESYEVGYEKGYNQGFEDCKNLILNFMEDFLQSHTNKEKGELDCYEK